ncbi:helix-turn-helix domain-containing protein [Actinophytocola sp.]|uniref:helix-turn-helix domain-containing protein n=1 Tax=Actinophytocola sp. TaxID=1872138 RepID=UPI003899DBE9
MAKVTLTDEEARDAGAVGSAGEVLAGPGAAVSDGAGVCGREVQSGVAAELGVWPQTVGKWRRGFLDRPLEGLVDEARPGAPRKITDEQVEEVVVATLQRQPEDATHWPQASMATRAERTVAFHGGTGLTWNDIPSPSHRRRLWTRSSTVSPTS